MDVRPATVGDSAAVARLYRLSAAYHAELDPTSYRVPDTEPVHTHYADLIRHGGSGSATVFVAVVEGEVVGMAEIRLAGAARSDSMLRSQVNAIAGIAVAPSHRRQGIGSALMRRAEAWARDQGAAAIMLDVLQANAPALEFYAACGYEIHGTLLLRRITEA